MSDEPVDEPQELEPEPDPEPPAAESEATNVNDEVVDSPTVNAYVVGVEIIDEATPEG